MKKSLFLITTAIMIAGLLIIPGCSGSNGSDETVNGDNGSANGIDDGVAGSVWEIAILSPDGSETVVALESIREMPAIELEAELRGEISTYIGPLLSLVLAEAGITEAVEVTVTAADGYSATISGEVAFSENTILAYEVDGVDLSGDEKNAPIQLVTTEALPQVWVGQVAVITVEY